MPERWRFIILIPLLILLLIAPTALAAAETVSYRSTTISLLAASQQGAVELGSLVIEINPLKEGEHVALIAMPRGYNLAVPGTIQSIEDPHFRLETSITGQYNEFRVKIDNSGDNRKATFIIPIKTSVPSGATGDLQVAITGLQGQLPDGMVTVGRIVEGKLNVTSSPAQVDVIRPGTEVPISIEVAEDIGGVLPVGEEVLKLILPEGFIWQQAKTKIEIEENSGFQPVTRFDASNSRVLYVDVGEQGASSKGVFKLSGFILAERTILPEANIRVESTGKNLASTLSLVIAQVVMPDHEARFIVGRDVYYHNGRALTLDVVPYLKEDRLFLPLRYVGLSLGVEPDNIKWNGQVAALTLGDITVQVRSGVKQILVNGSTVNMDVAAEVQFPGRVMLPYRFIAEAFGATVNWDAENRTVTMEL